MIQATMRLADPSVADATVTITMPLRAWRELMNQLPTGWPAWRVSAIIGALLSRAEGGYTETLEYKE